MPKNRQHYRKIKYPDKVTKQNALYLSGYFYLVLWEVEMLISRQPLDRYSLNQRKNDVALILAIYHVQNNNNLNGVNFLVNSSSIRVFLG